LLDPQAVDERVDEGREVVAGWEDDWGNMRVLDGEFGDIVHSFVASNAAVSLRPNEGYIAVGGFQIKLYVDSPDQRVRRIDISDSEEGCKRGRSNENVLRQGRLSSGE